MSDHQKKSDHYSGFEQGPIRPPSEANSLFIRVTRNCPWNRCSFCPVYKETKFSQRPVEDIKRDINLVFRFVELLQAKKEHQGELNRQTSEQLIKDLSTNEAAAFQAAYHWLFVGQGKSVFLQDANSLIIKPKDLVEILIHLKNRFPQIERITSYARAQTVAHRKDDDLKALADAGLNRLHLGLESGCDEVLKLTDKGTTKDEQIKAGRKVKNAGIELSEYLIPGLGGEKLSTEHARESADAINQINPDFIRLRTLAVIPGTPLDEACQTGSFIPCSEVNIVREIVSFIENLAGITSVLKSDHVLNLFTEVEGTLPDDQESMLAILRRFLELDPPRQRLYQIGRRLGYLASLADLDSPRRVAHAEQAIHEWGVDEKNIDEIIETIKRRYV